MGAAESGQMGNASAEAAMTAAGGAAVDEPGAPLATTHGPAAEVLYEGAECDVDMGNAAGAPVAEAMGVRPPRPSNWGSKPSTRKRTGGGATRESRMGWGYDVLGLPRQSAFYQNQRRKSRFVDSASEENKARAVVDNLP